MIKNEELKECLLNSYNNLSKDTNVDWMLKPFITIGILYIIKILNDKFELKIDIDLLH